MKIMRLLIKRGNSLINDMHFDKGPIYIGRQPQCQIFLPDRAVSRQHAVILTGNDGAWFAQDLESANRTFVNGRPMKKVPLQEGDVVGVADFTIEAHFGDQRHAAKVEVGKPVDVDLGGETMIDGQEAVPSIYSRKARHGEQQTIHLPTQRIDDFYKLNIALARKDDQEDLLVELNRLLLQQFSAYHAWTGLRETTTGPLTCHGGSTRAGVAVTLDQLPGKMLIQQALHDECYLLLPDVEDLIPPSETHSSIANLCSAMAAPIVAPAGAYGIIYLDNDSDQPPYNHHDFDYLTLVSTQIAALLEHIA